MNSFREKYLVIITTFAFILANTAMGFAQSDFENIETEDEIETVFLQTENFEPDKLIRIDEEMKVKQDEFMARLKSELNLSKTDYRQLLNSINDAQERLKLVTEEKMTLKEHLENLDSLINATTAKLIDVIKQVLETENEIALLYEQIEMREVALNYQKDLLKDYIRLIYKEENNYFSINENGNINAFKLLLTDGSVGDNLKELEYFNLLNEAGQQMVEKLDSLNKELVNYERDLNRRKIKLSRLQKKIEDEKEQLELQKESKENLLELTMGQEEIYQQLLEQTLMEQEQLLNDVKTLNDAIVFVEKKIEEEGAGFNPDEYVSLLDNRTQALYNFHINLDDLDSEGFIWPVEPDLGISAYFHDPGYAGVFGVQHNAIDLPEYQGSPIRATAGGVVFTAKDNGYGYSYIILAHANGFMTVYGHISDILVEEGQVVSQGAVIGLSGGMPGTVGAGYMTTGPHLHFEILSNGFHVDPLDYLPIEDLTEEQIIALPEKYYDDWENSVIKSKLDSVSRS
ncbi:peptidoglycan DD-metalloendopeptidase family protein [Candidatus Peregrinibacteria bacterium]|nr:peptidoglycan DD-metalloendopeptidase family protein [Candidatus Peregrinibacteria bacterium]